MEAVSLVDRWEDLTEKEVWEKVMDAGRLDSIVGSVWRMKVQGGWSKERALGVMVFYMAKRARDQEAQIVEEALRRGGPIRVEVKILDEANMCSQEGGKRC